MWSILLHGVETRTVSQISIIRLEAFEMWTMRRLMRISWKDRMSNERVMTSGSVRRKLIQEQKLWYFGHLMRHDSLRRDLLERMLEGKRAKGRPRAQWKNVQGWLEMRFFSATERQKAEALRHGSQPP